MQLTEINKQLQQKFGNNCLAAMKFFTPIIEVKFNATIGKTRSMDIFEEHILKLVNASGGSIDFNESVKYLGCRDDSFFKDAANSLSVSSALKENYISILTRGDTFDKSISQLSIDEATQDRTIKVWCDILGRRVWFSKPRFLLPTKFKDKQFEQIITNSGAFGDKDFNLNNFDLLPVPCDVKDKINEILFKCSPKLIDEVIYDSREACGLDERILSIDNFESGESYCAPVVAMGLVDQEVGDWYIECYDPEAEQMLPQFSQGSFLTFLGDQMHELYEEQQQGSDSYLLSPPLPIEFIDDELVANQKVKKEDLSKVSNKETIDLSSVKMDIANTSIEVIGKSSNSEAKVDSRNYKNDTLHTLEAKEKLIKDIKNAKHEIIINVPFLNTVGVEQFIGPFKYAVENSGCKVLVLWGIADTYEEECSYSQNVSKGYKAEKAKNLLNDIIDSDACNTPTVEWRPKDHSKWVMIDRMIYYHGSYNVLSYAPDPRREKSVRVERMERYEKAPLEKIATNLKFIPRSLRHPKNIDFQNWKDWFQYWHPSLRLCCTPTIIDQLISGLPENMHGPRQLRVLIETLKGATMSLVSQSCSPEDLNDAICRLTEQFKIDQINEKTIKKKYNRALNDYKKILGSD